MSVHNFPEINNRRPNSGGSEPPMELIERVAKIEAKLDAVLPTLATKSDILATKADMHSEFNIQTWRIIGAVLACSGILLAGLKLIP